MQPQTTYVVSPGYSGQPQRSLAVAYILWFFLGGAGAHRFYLGAKGSAVLQLFLGMGGFVLTLITFGLYAIVWDITLCILGIWLLVDICLMPGLLRQYHFKSDSPLLVPQHQGNYHQYA
ncbi:hypothetical protein KIPB_007689 [Kipferlia bialata]|uniref:TM2 domain-containing protein n=1 Tax=Kipferlia bialata TaxID=797122 RepID=A0A9K3GK85_9EUKA|nr:hypothetical protein KIPB_007689 [Kipferlia bialata]|eukprot:g7689.t1